MTFIIAEVGSNWKTEDDLIHSIVQAKECGADAVKFQAFSHFDLYGQVNTRFEELHYNRLRWDFMPTMGKKCRSIGIEFMCTVFNHELVPTIDTQVNIHKVASSNMMDLKLLKAVAKTGKQVFLSTGGWHMDHIRVAMSHFDKGQAVPLYCQPKYDGINPDLRCIDRLVEEFGIAGFSDHSSDSSYMGWSAANIHDARAIEKHVNFTDYTDTPDAGHSLHARDFRRYVLNIRDEFKPELPTRFHDMQMFHYARPVVTRDCLPGEKVEFRYMRVKEANSFNEYGEDLSGCTAKISLRTGDVLEKKYLV